MKTLTLNKSQSPKPRIPKFHIPYHHRIAMLMMIDGVDPKNMITPNGITRLELYDIKNNILGALKKSNKNFTLSDKMTITHIYQNRTTLRPMCVKLFNDHITR